MTYFRTLSPFHIIALKIPTRGGSRILVKLRPNLDISPEFVTASSYSQLPLRQTPLGPAVSVRLREMSVL